MRDVVLSAHGSGHLDLEELAAFLDGRLREERRAEIRRHLGECPDCYEIFDETAQIQQEMEPAVVGEVLSGPFSKPWGLWLGSAAAAVVVAGVGIGIYQGLSRPADVSLASLTASLGSHVPQIERRVWQSRMRGARPEIDGEKLSESSFQVGVELVNLQAGLDAGNAQIASGAAANINGLLPDLFVDQKTITFYQELNVRLEKTPPRDLTQQAAQVGDSAFQDDFLFVDFGKWVEAGRLAAVARFPSYFEQRGVRRFARDLRGEEEGKSLPAEVAAALTDVERLLDKDSLRKSDYDALRDAFARILRYYYPRGEPYADTP